jgi:hypothetical protein
VYEAARKLNMQAGELVKILEAKGIHSSPISTIAESVFNQLLEEMVSVESKLAGGEPPATLKLVSFKEKAEVKPDSPSDAVSSESPRPALTLAPEPGARKDQEVASPAALASVPASSKDSAKETSAEAQPPPPPAAAPAPKREERSGAAIFAMLTLVILMALGMGYVAWSVNNQTARIDAAIASMRGVNEKLSLAEKAIDLQGKQIAHNEAGLTDLAEKVGSAAHKGAKSDLATSSAALEELATALPAGPAERARDLARQLDALASAM